MCCDTLLSMPTIDDFIIQFDRALRTLAAPARARRPSPAVDCPEVPMSDSDKIHVARLMRINHTGEVCAQALYQGQALTARVTSNRLALKEAAQDEVDHLAWCESRIVELGGRTSILNPVWYTGSLALGVLAGLAGDQWNLAFLEETEKQVGRHLEGHLARVPQDDQRTRSVIHQMKVDEEGHAALAHRLGAAPMPQPVQWVMRWASRLMTSTVYWV